MSKRAIAVWGVGVLVLTSAGAWAAPTKLDSEVIHLGVNVGAQVCKVDIPDGISLCSIGSIPWEPVSIVLTEHPTSDPSYSFWSGDWSDTETVHGLTFEGHLRVTKQEHRFEDGTSTWYNFWAEIRDSSGHGPSMSFYAGQISDLRGVTLNSAPVVQGDYTITPNLYVGPALTLQPGPIVTTTPIPIPSPIPTGGPSALTHPAPTPN